MYSPRHDDLMTIYYRLARLSNIADMRLYSNLWRNLAVMFALAGQSAMSESCLSRAAFYGVHRCGSYIRVKQGESLVELIPLS